MLALRKKYPVLNTLASFVESSKEDSSSVSKTNSSTEPHSALSNSKVIAFINVIINVEVKYQFKDDSLFEPCKYMAKLLQLRDKVKIPSFS